MNLEARIERYRKRGFQQAEAEIIVLMEEAASGLFAAFPDRFILFGGATLVLFYDSPRLSRDLDLLARVDELPPASEVAKVIEASIQPPAEALGIGEIDCQPEGTNQDFIKIWLQAHQRRLFSVDLTRIGGTVLKSEIVNEKLTGADDKTVAAPSANYLLLQKCETFLDRRYTKSRDAFDIEVLLRKGANLDGNLKAHLEDFIQMRDLDADWIRARINSVDRKLCTVELRNLLPQELFSALAIGNFTRLRQSLETLFADWL
jgi:hypothetical protein